MKPHARAVLQRLRVRKHLDGRVRDSSLFEGAGRDQILSARDVRDIDAAHVHRGAVPGDRLGLFPSMHLHAADFDLDR